MILNQAQAEAVYSAMCALNNVGGKLDVKIPAGNGLCTRVFEAMQGIILITEDTSMSINRERHANQSDFATAYNLA